MLGLLTLVLVLIYGTEIKGARRWISLFGQSLQPSEFIKPLFSVFTAWLLSKNYRTDDWKEYRVSGFFFVVLVLLLLLQPDVGMTLVVAAVWAGQLFIAGIPMIWVAVLAMAGFILVIGAYNFFPHVTYRVDSFLASFDGQGSYQVKRSLQAFEGGGLFGRGPAEGVVKQNLPDSHTDFIFAVAGEEFGALACILIVALYGVIVVRGLIKMLHEEDMFVLLAVSGLLIQFGIQASINMGVALNLFPTKGMTLPFISYGGSSMLAISIAMGMMLALTRKRYGVRFTSVV
jgi:cell division protein FtsW